MHAVVLQPAVRTRSALDAHELHPAVRTSRISHRSRSITPSHLHAHPASARSSVRGSREKQKVVAFFTRRFGRPERKRTRSEKSASSRAINNQSQLSEKDSRTSDGERLSFFARHAETRRIISARCAWLPPSDDGNGRGVGAGASTRAPHIVWHASRESDFARGCLRSAWGAHRRGRPADACGPGAGGAARRFAAVRNRRARGFLGRATREVGRAGRRAGCGVR